MSEHNVERIKEMTRKNFRIQQLEEKHDLLQIRLAKEEEYSKELSEANRILEQEVKLSEEKINNAYKRIAEYANKAYMKRLGEPDFLPATTLDVTT